MWLEDTGCAFCWLLRVCVGGGACGGGCSGGLTSALGPIMEVTVGVKLKLDCSKLAAFVLATATSS